MTAIYLDTAALAKGVTTEPESAALGRFMRQHGTATRVSSELAIAELRRAAQRIDDETAERADEVLNGIDLRQVTRTVLRAAATLEPPIPRSLDAIHLATALELADELEALVTYDHRLADAARSHGLYVASPA